MLDNLTIQTKLDDPVYPSYGTNGSVGLDFAVQEYVTIYAEETKLVDLHYNVLFPTGMWGLLIARSSLHKKNLVLANGAGIIDNDYRGPDDTLKVALKNVGYEPVDLKKGDRVVQLVLLPMIKPYQLTIDFIEEDKGGNRGGFGSTGN